MSKICGWCSLGTFWKHRCLCWKLRGEHPAAAKQRWFEAESHKNLGVPVVTPAVLEVGCTNNRRRAVTTSFEVTFYVFRRRCTPSSGLQLPRSALYDPECFPAVPFTCAGLMGIPDRAGLVPVMACVPHIAMRHGGRILMVADQSNRVSALCTSCDSGKERVPKRRAGWHHYP